jgi:hypothetical protein
MLTKSHIFRACTFFIILHLLGCSPPKDNLIIPGKRVGEIEIGRTKSSDVGKGDGSVSEKYSAQKLSIAFDGNRVSAVEVFGRNYQTKLGIGVGDSEERVTAAYGRPEITEVPLMGGSQQVGTLAKRALHYPGIRYLLNDQHRVASIIVSAE